VADTFKERCTKLVERILRDYGDALQTTLERLSVAPSFDRAAFIHMWSRLLGRLCLSTVSTASLPFPSSREATTVS
jgi:hypothetical protein